MRFDLTDLRLFLHVVELGSITKGAAAANLALASASARIGGMEATLGAALLERGRRGICPTAAGEVLARHARLLLGQAERMRGELGAFASGLKGEVRLFTNTAALTSLVPDVLRDFLAAQPQIDVRLEERHSAEIVSAVASGQADLGIVADTVNLGSLMAKPLTTDRLLLITSHAHPFARRATVAFAELLDQPFVGLSGGAVQAHLALHAQQLGRQLTYRVRLRSFDAVCRLVEAGVGIGVVPEEAALGCRGIADFATVPLADAWAHRRLVLVRQPGTDLPLHTLLLEEAFLAAVVSRRAA